MKFDGNFNDASNNGNNGVQFGGVGFVSGIKGNAAYLDGINDYIQLVNENSFDFVNNFSISMWIRPRNWRDWGWLVTKTDSSGGPGWYLGKVSGQGQLGLLVSNGTSFSSSVYSTYLYEGRWYHIVANYDANGKINIYINGMKADSPFANNNVVNPNKANNQIVTIGAGSYYLGGFSNMTMDNLRIYNRVLSDQEVMQLFNARA